MACHDPGDGPESFASGHPPWHQDGDAAAWCSSAGSMHHHLDTFLASPSPNRAGIRRPSPEQFSFSAGTCSSLLDVDRFVRGSPNVAVDDLLGRLQWSPQLDSSPVLESS